MFDGNFWRSNILVSIEVRYSALFKSLQYLRRVHTMSESFFILKVVLHCVKPILLRILHTTHVYCYFFAIHLEKFTIYFPETVKKNPEEI